jgi:hypothetical protein
MPTHKQRELIELYKQMAQSGIDRQSAPRTYSLMNIRGFRDMVLPHFKAYSVDTVLDYGCGDTSWDDLAFASGISAKLFFGISAVARYEPSLNIDERQECDAVTCFDVLEHIYLADVSAVVWELFSLARKLVVVNVACYPAAAKLPNGENAHITVRPPMWWKGLFDSIAPAFPDITYILYASTEYLKCTSFQPYCVSVDLLEPGYTRNLE